MYVLICIFNNNISRSSKRDYLINILLSKVNEYYNLNIPKENIVYDKNGKPFFKDYNVFFNYSYSDLLGVIGISNNNLGIDIEKIKIYNEKIVNRIYSKNEKEYINKSNNINYEYTKLWTFKESYIKYKGNGIDDFFYNLNFIENDSYLYNDLFYTIDYEDYIITVCSKDLAVNIEIIKNYD